MSSSFLSSSVLVHVAGVIAVSQLFLVRKYRQEFFDSLNRQNATGALHEALDRFADALSLVFPAGGERASTVIGAGTLLQVALYLAAGFYAFYLLRLATVYQYVHGVVYFKFELLV